ncbi:hypothetical protein GCM10009638_24640 [Luteococcus sanguinis]
MFFPQARSVRVAIHREEGSEMNTQISAIVMKFTACVDTTSAIAPNLGVPERKHLRVYATTSNVTPPRA